MAGIGNTLTTYINNDPVPVVTTRNTGESDNDFIDRHCRALLARLQGTSGVTKLQNTETGVELGRQPGWTDEQFVAAFDAELKAAV